MGNFGIANGEKILPVSLATALEMGAETLHIRLCADAVFKVGAAWDVSAGTIIVQKGEETATVNRLVLDQITGKLAADILVVKEILHLNKTSTTLSDANVYLKGSVIEGNLSHVGNLVLDAQSSIDLGTDYEEKSNLRAGVILGSFNGYGDLVVEHSLQMGAGAQFLLDISEDGTQNDHITVKESVAFTGATGATVLIKDSDLKQGWTTERSYEIMTLGVAGAQLPHWNIEGLDKLNAHLEYAGKSVHLVLTQNYKSVDKTRNQKSIASAFEAIEKGAIAPTGELATAIEALHHTESGAEAKNALEQLGANSLTALMAQHLAGNIDHIRMLRDTIGQVDRSEALQTDKMKSAQGSYLWMNATNSYTSVDTDVNGAGFNRNAWGGTLGMEKDAIKGLTFGAAFSYEFAKTCTDNPTRGGAKFTSDNMYLDAFVKYDLNRWHHRGVLGYGLSNIDADRNVGFANNPANFSKRASAGTKASTLNIGYESAYDFKLADQSTLQALATFESSYAHIQGYNETGSIGNAGLSVKGQHAWASVIGLGTRWMKDFSAISGAPKASFALKALLTANIGDQNATTRLSVLGDANQTQITLSGTKRHVAGALIGGDLVLPVTDKTRIFGGLSYEVKNAEQNTTGRLGVSYAF